MRETNDRGSGGESLLGGSAAGILGTRTAGGGGGGGGTARHGERRRGCCRHFFSFPLSLVFVLFLFGVFRAGRRNDVVPPGATKEGGES